MKKVTSIALALAVAGIAKSAMAQTHTATGTIDRTFYGDPLSIQTVNTGFGDSTSGSGLSNGGSELDGGYAHIANNTLYLFLAGNFENNGNHLNIFIADGRTGQTTLNANTNNGVLKNMNGSVFSPGFSATYALDGNLSSGTFFVDQYDLIAGTGNFVGSIGLTNGVGGNQSVRGLAIGINNTNAAGVNGNGGTAADSAAAATVSTGFEIGIPLTALGSPTGGNIQILADINAGGNTFLSNQFLPGLAAGSGNVGNGGKFDFSGTPNFWFQVAVPASGADGTWTKKDSGSWGLSTNWANGNIPNAAGATAIFTTAANNPSTVTLDGNRTVGSLSFNSTNSYIIASGTGGSLNMSSTAGNATIQDFGGNHAIAANVVLTSSTDVDIVNHGDNLTFSGNISGPGQLSVNNLGGGGAFPLSNIILSGNNSFGGGVLIKGGNLQLGSATALPAGTAITFDASDVPSPVLDLNGFGVVLGSITTVTGAQTTNTGAKGLIINSAASGNAAVTYAGSNANPSTFFGTISDSNGGGNTTSLVVASGSLALTGINTYLGGTTVAAGATLTATPSGALPDSSFVTNNGALVLNSAGTLGSITGSGNTTVSGGVTFNLVSLSQHGLTIADTSRVALVGPQSVAVTLSSLTIGDNTAGTTAQLDIGLSKLYVNYSGPSPILTIRNLLTAAFDGGNWDGNGITSIAAHTDASQSTGVGYADLADLSHSPATIAGGTILVVDTSYGDSDLNGVVDLSDFHRYLDGLAGGGSTWVQGDYTYDGVVDIGNDFNLFLSNYINQGGSLGALEGEIESSDLSSGQKANLLAAVPEPSSIALIGLGAAAIAARHRRGK